MLGGSIGWRKIVVGGRDWRLVWRVGHDANGVMVIDIAEIWAFGARSDAEVYAEVQSRVDQGEQPTTHALADVLTTLGKIASSLNAIPEPNESEEIPDWLSAALIKVAGFTTEAVAEMSADQAQAAWMAYTTGTPN